MPATRLRRWIRRILTAVLFLTVGLTAAVFWWQSQANRYQTSGTLSLSGPQAPITIVRDGKGMPYVHADSLADVLFGQGFVTAQDRMFQLQLMKLKAAGRLTELVGAPARSLDVRIRTLGIRRAAEKHAAMLNSQTRASLQAYADGINAFLESCPDDLPLEFSAADIPAESWSVEDSLSIMYLMSWDTSANLSHELLLQALVDRLGAEQAQLLAPLNINPDAPTDESPSPETAVRINQPLGLLPETETDLPGPAPVHVGSNNWATSGSRSEGGHVLLAGDPHLDSRLLPGIMYAVGFVTPQTRAVGAGVPGLPGFTIGRNEHVACSVTNSYGDVQDLYIETLDPDRPGCYRDGGQSLPFHVETETLRIRDSTADDGYRSETIKIRHTTRGPVVSELFPHTAQDRVLTLRWAALESMQPDIGLTELFTATSVDDVEQALRNVTSVVLNFVFADADGNIAWRVSGRLPQRTAQAGTLPVVVDADHAWTDPWQGWIPFHEMPQARNPSRGWLGTANHYTVPHDYAHYLTNYASPSWRYRRLTQRLSETTGLISADDHWDIQRDTRNLMAEAVLPVMIAALQDAPRHQQLADILAAWNCHDDVQAMGPTIFQTLFCEYARAVFEDELGPDLARQMLGNWYFWQERLVQQTRSGQSPWFDNINTPEIQESRDDLLRQAAARTVERLTEQLGADPAQWRWGRVHTIQFVNPLRRSGIGAAWLGTEPRAIAGSGETLYRGRYDFSDPHEVTFAACLRMVVDFGDPDKVRAVLAGGSAGRTFHPHQKDQVEAWLSGEPQHWWFSDRAIQQHAVSRLVLRPQ